MRHCHQLHLKLGLADLLVFLGTIQMSSISLRPIISTVVLAVISQSALVSQSALAQQVSSLEAPAGEIAFDELPMPVEVLPTQKTSGYEELPPPVGWTRSATTTDSAKVWVGVRLDSVTPTIVKVTDASPAQRSGLLPGDKIICLGGKCVRTTQDIVAGLHSRQPGSSITLVVVRGSVRRTTQVTLGAPADHETFAVANQPSR